MELNKTEVKQLAITTDGKLEGLPENFTKLSDRKQRNVVFAMLMEYNKDVASLADSDESEAREIKRLTRLINSSKEGKQLQQLKAGKSDRRRQKERLLLERNGVLKVAKRMGLDVTEELKKLKEIN